VVKLLSILVAVVLLASAVIAGAQQPKKISRIGYLSNTDSNDEASSGIRVALAKLGYIEGQNIAFEYRYAEGKVQRLPGLAAELVRSKVDIIIAFTFPAVQAAKNASQSIPIVMGSVGPDPVGIGLVESLVRPGRNVTGITNIAIEIAGKRLELLKEAVPKITRVAALYDSGNSGNAVAVKELQSAAPSLKLTVKPWELRSAEDFNRVFSATAKERLDGLYVPGGPLMSANRNRIADLALKNRLSSVFPNREFVAAGGLMSYGADLAEQYRRAAYFVDRILTGTKPADLPVERPMKFDFAINLQTAKKIGVTIPQSVLFRADWVIK
jgi:putative tryptophan/tyrosine transport system substrate-binding protein